MFEARRVYIGRKDLPETMYLATPGRHHLRGGKDILIADCHDRLFIAPEDDFVLDFRPAILRISPAKKTDLEVTWGILSCVTTSISDQPSIADLFQCISSLCHVPGEESVFRSFPLFRRPLRIRSGSEKVPKSHLTPGKSDITIFLPADLRYLYAAGPLASYIGARVELGESPVISVAGQQTTLPGDALAFEQWACDLLRLTFHTDCAVRYWATTSRLLAGIDLNADLGIPADKILSMSMGERILACLQARHRGSGSPKPWHTASYLDPLPSSITQLPPLLQSLSAIFSPAGRRVTELEVVQMEVRQFLNSRSGTLCSHASDHIVLPTLQNAFIHRWLADGYPIDSVKQLKSTNDHPMACAGLYDSPKIAIICNEDSMVREAIVMRDTLKSLASIKLLRNLSPDRLISVFSDGYDIVQYIGHSDSKGFKCQGGYADLSTITEQNTRMFFFNSCSSYLQGTRLLEKGSVCGIATLYNVIGEAAVDVCASFYRLLVMGYPVLAAYLGAKECSVQGKEYLFMGDSSASLLGSSAHMPLYRLSRSRHGYTLSCVTVSPELGFIHSSGGGLTPGIGDFGICLARVSIQSLAEHSSLPAGACISNGEVFDSVAHAASKILEPLSSSPSESYYYTF